MASSAAMVDSPLRSASSLVATGKVREIHALDATTLLFVTTDRISAFDVVMKNAIPQKGAILTLLSRFWFEYLSGEMPSLKTHFIKVGVPESCRKSLKEDEFALLQHRSMVVRRLKVLPLESIVRGYITGSLWSSYKESEDKRINGIQLPQGLQESQKLPKPLWTPSTKAEQGEHDENISPDQAESVVGKVYANQIRELSLQLYEKAHAYAAGRGIILADTKFEFALDESTEPPTVVLIDEVLTPDSSRFWPADKYELGRSQESFDKQYLRDWLVKTGQKGKEGVKMPAEVVQNTERRYREAYEALVGSNFEAAMSS